ncbi:hypothetical protein [Streptomyces nanshensis]|uniref:Uncharacterized protein n=1 Tax=Streptomyces nanshensis TaxID=518642 RepID=A0A1E7KRD5_9ACTN|nr:hypothetical protein [Streptomyces nanshensis]OEV06500.1 hypothetical protein AN218_30430 [Streptomyces nanshensis]
MVTTLISVVAVLVSLGSLALAYAAGRRSHMPVLQFVWESGQGDGSGEPAWRLVNVGTGPATNVVVAQAERTGLARGVAEDSWRNPVLVPSIPAGGALDLSWLGGTRGLECGLGASYTDVERYFYTTKCGDDVSMFFVGLHLPRWPLLKWEGEKAVRTWWGVEELPASGWSPVTATHVRRIWWLPPRYGVARRLGGWADPVRSYRGGTAR